MLWPFREKLRCFDVVLLLLTPFVCFPALNTGCTFFHVEHGSHVFPRLAPITRFPALAGTGYVFPRLARVTCFPALGKGYTFSRTWHRLHVFPLLTRVTRFLMLESCNFDLWFWLVPHMNWLAFTFCGRQNRINLKVNHTKSKRLLKSSNLFLNVVSQLITRASSSSRLSGSWLCLTWRALCLSTVVKQEQKRNSFAWLVVSWQTWRHYRCSLLLIHKRPFEIIWQIREIAFHQIRNFPRPRVAKKRRGVEYFSDELPDAWKCHETLSPNQNCKIATGGHKHFSFLLAIYLLFIIQLLGPGVVFNPNYRRSHT